MIVRKYLLILLAAVMPLTLAACDDDDNVITPAGKARVMVVHASPDAPGVDLIVDNNIAGTNLTYPNNTGYLEIDPGSHNVKVNVTGTQTTVIEADVVLEADKNYSVFAANSAASLEPVVLVDDLNAPASGKAHVRFLHLSPDAPAVDITLADGTVLFGDYVFKESSAFTPVDASSYNLQVRLAGSSTVVLELNGINLQSGKIYTVFAKGFVNGTGEQALGAEIIVNR